MLSNIFWGVALSVTVSFILGFLTYNLGQEFAPSKEETKPGSKSASA
jgi:hypothetical protein